MRLSWVHSPLSEVSVIARKDTAARELTEWRSSSGVGYEVALLEFGEHSAEAMLTAASQSQSLWTWLKRAGGILLTWAGWALLFGTACRLALVLALALAFALAFALALEHTK